MSRSRRQPIVKDRPRNEKKSSLYWRIVRRVINGKVREIVKNDDEINLPEPKEIVNDYDYCDYVIDYRDPSWSEKHKEYIEKQKRK
jgi:hypothetical protein